MRKKADSVNIWSRYLKGTPAQEIYGKKDIKFIRNCVWAI